MKYKKGEKVHWQIDNIIYTNVRVQEVYKEDGTYKLRGFENIAYEDEIFSKYKLTK